MELPQSTIDNLVKLAKKNAAFEDEEGLDSYFNGNQDDSYQVGCTDGEINLAREILCALNMESSYVEE